MNENKPPKKVVDIGENLSVLILIFLVILGLSSWQYFRQNKCDCDDKPSTEQMLK